MASHEPYNPTKDFTFVAGLESKYQIEAAAQEINTHESEHVLRLPVIKYSLELTASGEFGMYGKTMKEMIDVNQKGGAESLESLQTIAKKFHEDASVKTATFHSRDIGYGRDYVYVFENQGGGKITALAIEYTGSEANRNKLQFLISNKENQMVQSINNLYQPVFLTQPLLLLEFVDLVNDSYKDAKQSPDQFEYQRRLGSFVADEARGLSEQDKRFNAKMTEMNDNLKLNGTSLPVIDLVRLEMELYGLKTKKENNYKYQPPDFIYQEQFMVPGKLLDVKSPKSQGVANFNLLSGNDGLVFSPESHKKLNLYLLTLIRRFPGFIKNFSSGDTFIDETKQINNKELGEHSNIFAWIKRVFDSNNEYVKDTKSLGAEKRSLSLNDPNNKILLLMPKLSEELLKNEEYIKSLKIENKIQQRVLIIKFGFKEFIKKQSEFESEIKPDLNQLSVEQITYGFIKFLRLYNNFRKQTKLLQIDNELIKQILVSTFTENEQKSENYNIKLLFVDWLLTNGYIDYKKFFNEKNILELIKIFYIEQKSNLDKSRFDIKKPSIVRIQKFINDIESDDRLKRILGEILLLLELFKEYLSHIENSEVLGMVQQDPIKSIQNNYLFLNALIEFCKPKEIVRKSKTKSQAKTKDNQKTQNNFKDNYGAVIYRYSNVNMISLVHE